MNNIKDFAVKVMGMTDDEVAALYNADGELQETAFSVLAEKDKERLRRIRDEHKEELTAKFNDGHAKAKKEERSKFEQEIREAFGVQSKAMGVDLVKEVAAKGVDGDIKTHPEYLQLERKLKDEFIPKEDYEIVRSEFDGFKSKVQRDAVISRAKADAKARFYALRPVLSKDKQRAANQEAEFLAKFEQFDFQVQDDGNHVVIRDGKRLVNDNLNPISFDELVKDLTVKYFDINEQEQKGSVGTTTTTTTAPVGSFKDYNEFVDLYAKENNPEIRVKMWNEAKTKGFVK